MNVFAESEEQPVTFSGGTYPWDPGNHTIPIRQHVEAAPQMFYDIPRAGNYEDLPCN